MLKKYFNLAINTASVTRYSMMKMVREESVMEHTGCVALLCLFIARDCFNNDYDVEVETLLTKALIHDLEESVIGDVVVTTKYASPEILDGLNALAEKTMAAITDDIGHPNLFYSWKTQKDDTLEGRIVSLCDLLSAVMKLYEESIIYGNKSALGAFKRIINAINKRIEKENNLVIHRYLTEALSICEEAMQ